MCILSVEISGEVMDKIERAAMAAGVTEEKFIADILSRFVVDPHIMEKREVAEGYIACGPVNLELAK